MAHTNPTYPQSTSVPGLDGNPYMNGYGPNCNACKDAPYQTFGPLFAGCDMCAEGFETMLTIDAIANDSEENVPGLDADIAGEPMLRLA